MLTDAPMLTQLESGKEFVVYSYTSLNSLGCVLMQERKVIAYYLYDEKCHVYTDHKSLKQRRWLELLKDDDMVINYHTSKTNVVADALSQKSLFALRSMNAQLKLDCDGSILAELKTKPLFFLQKIQELQFGDPNLLAKWKMVKNGQIAIYIIGSDDNLYSLKQNILSESHNNVYWLHLKSTKIYCDLKQIYWWLGMKHEIFEFVSKWLMSQQVKAKHQVPSGLLQPIMIPE
ncbi:integrase [Gossypium australe]|uniref:Integrase n=1 Tax=Gossypium australe TaxID=47621 RepID=A0A5B6WSY0_9ROSI|nr:integrase [Gossypium australe]